MLDIYRRNDWNNKEYHVGYVDSYVELFKIVHIHNIEAFGYSQFDRTVDRYILEDYPCHEGHIIYRLDRYCYTLYENGKFVTPDRLVGLYRAYNNNRTPYKRVFRKGAHRNYRSVNTLQERKAAQYQDDDYHVPIRPSRNAKNLRAMGDWDDDPMTHNDKSWKTQSRRKRQWKAKKFISSGVRPLSLGMGI